jgi:cytochrome c2
VIAVPTPAAAIGACALTALAAPAAPDTGAALIARGQCGRCHDVTALAVEATPRERSCAGCHRWIHDAREQPEESARWRKVYPAWDRYLTNVRSFLDVPDLAASAARLTPDFVASYLRAPFKVRPALHESMIRTGYAEDEATRIASWLVQRARVRRPWSEAAAAASAVPPSTRPEAVAEGARLYQRLACGTCHALGSRPASLAMAAAPDLAHVARRIAPADAAAFIADPAAFGGEPRMPRYPMSATEAARLRDFLWSTAASGASSLVAGAADLPLLARPVRYAEVRERVLAAVCVHCHMSERGGADGGPGNTGGLGWRGAGLDLETWAGVVRGARGADGRRHSVLAPAPDGGEPPLLARLRQRYAEHAAERAGPAAVRAGGAPGMPLGLPPLAPADLQLVRSWLAQGAPGPDGTRSVAQRARRLRHQPSNSASASDAPTPGPPPELECRPRLQWQPPPLAATTGVSPLASLIALASAGVTAPSGSGAATSDDGGAASGRTSTATAASRTPASGGAPTSSARPPSLRNTGASGATGRPASGRRGGGTPPSTSAGTPRSRAGGRPSTGIGSGPSYGGGGGGG